MVGDVLLKGNKLGILGYREWECIHFVNIFFGETMIQDSVL